MGRNCSKSERATSIHKLPCWIGHIKLYKPCFVFTNSAPDLRWCNLSAILNPSSWIFYGERLKNPLRPNMASTCWSWNLIYHFGSVILNFANLTQIGNEQPQKTWSSCFRIVLCIFRNFHFQISDQFLWG